MSLRSITKKCVIVKGELIFRAIPTRTVEINTMNIRAKTAFITTSLNIILTVLKFTLYAVTMSQAILAEAWHSFSDIATSVMVLFAVCKPENSSDSSDQHFTKDREVIASFIIGFILLVLSVSLIIQVSKVNTVIIENAAFAGIVFIVFSFFSYVISMFETKMGEQHKSISLMADGNHARADMAASLLTGISLILYPIGINIDIPIAGLIALLILSYAIDTFVNIYRKGTIDEHHSFSIIRAFGNKIKVFWFYLEQLPQQKQSSLISKCVVPVSILCLLIMYGWSGIYYVGPTNQACIERLGKRLEPVGPGIHFGWPWPIDQIRLQDVTTIREISIGNISINKTRPLLWSKKHGDEEPFISGDQYFLYPYVSIHYRINDIQKFVYEHSYPVAVMKGFAHQTLTRLLSSDTFDHITGSHRSKMVSDMHSVLQKRLDQSKTGIDIISVHFKDIHPPISVADAFERVIASYQYKQNQINQALGYQNDIVPNARGNAEKTLAEAKTWQLERIQIARALSNRFLSIYPDTLEKKEIVKKQAYFQTMKECLMNRSMILIDKSIDSPDIWLKGLGKNNRMPYRK